MYNVSFIERSESTLFYYPYMSLLSAQILNWRLKPNTSFAQRPRRLADSELGLPVVNQTNACRTTKMMFSFFHQTSFGENMRAYRGTSMIIVKKASAGLGVI